MLQQWRIGTLDCQTLAITYCHLDNPQLTADEALSIVARWNVSASGRRLSWLVGRSEENAKPAIIAKALTARGKPLGA